MAGAGAAKPFWRTCLGSVNDYCVYHCDCPVVVVQVPEGEDGNKNPHCLHSKSLPICTPIPHSPKNL